MSVETSLQEHHYESVKEDGLTICPACGFKVPDSLVICWKCGTRFKK